MDLLGTPDLSASHLGLHSARRYILRDCPKRRPKLATTIWSMSQTVTEDALHLLEHMLMFNPVKSRLNSITAFAPLAEAAVYSRHLRCRHPYLDEARLRYHSCMCTCCPRPTSSAYQHQRHACLQHQPHLMQQHHPEPVCLTPMSDNEELAITDVHAARLKLADLIQRRPDRRDAAIAASLGAALRNIADFQTSRRHRGRPASAVWSASAALRPPALEFSLANRQDDEIWPFIRHYDFRLCPGAPRPAVRPVPVPGEPAGSGADGGGAKFCAKSRSTGTAAELFTAQVHLRSYKAIADYPIRMQAQVAR
uniref:Uncharacterized protein n=1 Tax=Macrostomum lignano TaxID=282301 RepID=A0A1I8JQ41_9PLAT